MSSSSTLPRDILEKILWDFPTKELVRTSILSKEWRYFWTKFPKVAFREELFDDDDSTDENQLPVMKQQQPRKRMNNMSGRCKFFNAIYQFLLLHQGPLVDFTLSMKPMKPSDKSVNNFFEIDQILLDLSRKNTVKKLRLRCGHSMPLTIFSFHQLTDLHLSDCRIYSPPTAFKGFGSLTTLCLEYVFIFRKTLMHILCHNPLLKSFSMLTGSAHDAIVISHHDEYKEAAIIDLFKYLPVIEHLTFCAPDIWCFGETVPQALATPLVHLKSLRLEKMCFLDKDWLRFLVLIIRSSPNLEKLKLQMFCKDPDPRKGHVHFYTVSMQDYSSDIRLEHLIELEIENYDNKKRNSWEFVKLILAKSPVLKTVRLIVYDKDEELKMLSSLVSAPHASPMVEIIGVCGGGKEHS